jgi:hypothetical protein
MPEMQTAVSAASEPAPPTAAEPIPAPPQAEENHAAAVDAGPRPIPEMQSAANAALPAQEPTVAAPIPAPPKLGENGAAVVEAKARPMPHIQSAARAALEAAQQRAAEIQQAQAKADERAERPFPKPTLAPKFVLAAKPESAPKAVAGPEPVPVAVANEPQTKIIEAEIKPEAIIIKPETSQAEETTIELNVFKVDKVPLECIHRMIAALTDAMGPMASLVVRDHVDAMGESTENFPKRRFHELVYSTSGEILSKPLRARYENVMSEEVRALGAFEE